MALSSEVLVAIVGLGGALIGALPGLISTLLNRRAEDKRHFNELVFKAATESWKLVAEKSASSRLSPLEHYIIHTAKMCEFAFSGEKITPESTAQRLKEIDAVMVVLTEHANAVSSGGRPKA
jgi:hypothetical protein